MPPGKIPQLLPCAALFSGAMASAANQQQVSVISEGQAVLCLVNIHAVHIRGVLQRDNIGAVLIQLDKIAAVLVQKWEVGGYDYFLCGDLAAVRHCRGPNQFPHRGVLINTQPL